MTLSPTALESAAVAALVEMDDRGLLKDVGDDLFDEIKNAVATAAITAYLAQAGKEGWVMVPRDPSPNMRFAGADYLLSQKRFVTASDMWPTWKVMLAAAGMGDEGLHLP